MVLTMLQFLPRIRYVPLPKPVRLLLRPFLATATLIGLLFATQAGISAPLRGPRADIGSYTVQPGDTLSAVAKQFNVSLKELAAGNGITNPDLVVIGDTLT